MIVRRKIVQRGGELLGIGGKVEKAAGSKTRSTSTQREIR